MTQTTLGSNDARTTDLPATGVIAITKSDSTILNPIPRAIHIGTGGTLAVQALDGTTATFTVTDGTLLPLRCVKILSAGTSASAIVGIY